MLQIEQFRNQEMAELQTKLNYQAVMDYFAGMIRYLTTNKILKKGDETIMAAQLSAPITVWINLCDREPAREEEVMELVRQHVMQFFAVYGKKQTERK